MKGFVPTPSALVDRMVNKLFDGLPPDDGTTLLDPGCGTGAFIEGVLRWGERTGGRLPAITGIDSDPRLLAEAKGRLGSAAGVQLVETDFLGALDGQFDYIVGNPPYVPITGLSTAEREAYRRRFTTATGRFDLYTLFFEQALRLLKPGGRLVFVTPEKFSYVESAGRLRSKLSEAGIREIEFIAESTFGDLVTYPVVTTIDRNHNYSGTRVLLRTGKSLAVRLPASGRSWLPLFNGAAHSHNPHSIADAFTRISCGVATGADQIFVVKDDNLSHELQPFAYATISGRSLVRGEEIRTSHSMLVPYSADGVLLPETGLGPLGEYLRRPDYYSR
ncbi:MAG: class I SAM-dependent DNA methyltransferase, partial [Gemmatimonadales bacterium]